MVSVRIHSDNVKKYKQIEKTLFRLFRLFDNLCMLCYEETIHQIKEGGNRNKVRHWCCCLTDNQVHDHWESLDNIQKVICGPNWYDTVKKKHTVWRAVAQKRSLPGNGPCPALGSGGCLICSCRPITCTTQLCEKMIFILSKMGISKANYTRPLQIEEIIRLPNILRIVYGQEKGKIDFLQVESYVKSIEGLRVEFEKFDLSQRRKMVVEAINCFLCGK